MVAIVTRELGAAPKGSTLSNSEVDTNFINLDEGKSEKYTVIKNMTGGTITPGTVVYITGSTGVNVTVALASASSEAASSKTFAIVVDTILNNETGRAVRDDVITGLNTSAYTEGSAIWLSTTAGQITNTKPTPPNHTVFLGYVVRSHASAGAILVKILNGYEIEELHNVLFSSLAGGDVLEYDAVTGLWENATPTSTNTASRLVKRDASGNFSAGTISAALSGNATTATTLQTARTINGTSFNGSANITTSTWGTARTVTIGSTGKSVDGSANVSWTITEIGAIPASEKGAVNGVATLGADGKVPSGQLPSFVDDVLEYTNLASFPATGETGKIYVALDTNKTYRWSGSAYIYITSGAVDSVNGMTGVVTVSTISGNAGSATTLQTSRNINGTPFNGSADITTARWGASRTVTIGNTDKSVDGSSAVSWSLAEIGALALTGGTLSGGLQVGYGGGDLTIRATAANDLGDLVWADYAGSEKHRIWDAGAGLNYRNNGGAGYLLVHAGNYNSYSPTLTGGGASGTWGINITGNAATATSAGNADTVDSIHATGFTRNFGSVTINPAGYNTNCTTAQFISWLTSLGAFNFTSSVMKCTWDYAGNNDITDTGFGQLELAGCVVETFIAGSEYIVRVTSPSTGTGAGGIHEYVNHGSGYSPGWRRVYTSSLNGNISGSAASIVGQANSATITASTGVNASNIVQRDANGYIYANHINFNTSETENPTINSFFTSNGDGWSRKSSLSHVKNMIRGVADGSWGISITGNAATATSADQIDGWAFRNTGSNSGVNADSLDSNGVTYYTAGVPNFTGNATDGALYSQAYSSSWQHQIAGDYRSGQIAIRGKNSGTWQAWRVVLDSSNWSSYVTAGISTINYNNDSNSTYQMLWGSGNAIYGTGGIYCNPATDMMYASQFQATSDERLKTNWRDLGEDFVRQLATVKHGIYDRLDIDLTQVGVSAQSLQRVLGESVSVGQDGMLSVNYGNAALVSSIQLAIKFVKLEDELSQIKEKLGLK